jgi:amino acid transporter
MSGASEGTLKRDLTLTAVVALGINGVIGQGIFLLPGLAAARMGPASMVSLALAGLLCILIALCFAEVGARFRSTGGAYVYAREAFGDFVGFEVGWMTCAVAVISWAALANGFTKVFAHFVPAVAEGWLQPAVCVALMTALMAINLFGAKMGATVSTFFSIAKLVPIVLFVVWGATQIDTTLYTPFTPQGWGPLAETTLLLLYAYVGFETLVVPAGEMKDPQKSVPVALGLVMLIVSVTYVAVLGVSFGTLPTIAGHANPVAAASSGFMGAAGGALIAAGIAISVFGTNAGAALVSPRRFYAMAERGDLPRWFAKVDPRSGSPIRSIVLTWALAAVLALTGSFKELAVLGVMARFCQYIPTCLAVLVLRRKDPEGGAGFRLPLGPVIPLVTVAICVWLLVNANPDRLVKGAIALGLGVPFYFLSRWYRDRE